MILNYNSYVYSVENQCFLIFYCLFMHLFLPCTTKALTCALVHSPFILISNTYQFQNYSYIYLCQYTTVTLFWKQFRDPSWKGCQSTLSVSYWHIILDQKGQDSTHTLTYVSCKYPVVIKSSYFLSLDFQILPKAQVVVTDCYYDYNIIGIVTNTAFLPWFGW